MSPDKMSHYMCLLAVTLLSNRNLIPSDCYTHGSDIRLVVASGTHATLPCQVEFRRSTASFDWYKDGEPIGTDEEGRITTGTDGSLLLKDTQPEDTGVYVCDVSNDMEMAQVNVTLIVLVPESAPAFNNMSALGELTLNQTVGSSVRLRCPARGNPRPQIKWFKNDVRMGDSDLGPELKKNPWSLNLRNLKLSDAGNYTCLVTNALGSINATFILEISESSRPDLSVFHPLNTTVKFGSSATFQCRVRSEATPHIQWLKRIDDGEGDQPSTEEHDIIKVQGENFRILKSSEVQERSDGSFLNKLVIPEAHETDTGKYICLGANAQGYSFRSAFLTVLPRPKSLPLGWSRSVSPPPGHPSSVLVAIPITLGVLVGILVALVVLCHRRRLDTPLPSRPSTSSRRLEFRNASRSGCDFAPPGLDALVTKIPPNVEKAEQEPTKEESAAVEEVVEESSKVITPQLSTQALSEVELDDNGVVVTKLCQQSPSAESPSCDGCYVLRDEV